MEGMMGAAANFALSPFLYAGFWGLGALWMASYKKYGGRRLDYGGGYEDYGGGYGGGGAYSSGYDDGGYGGGGGGYAPAYSNSYDPPKSSKQVHHKGFGKLKSHSLHHHNSISHSKGYGDDCDHKRRRRNAGEENESKRRRRNAVQENESKRNSKILSRKHRTDHEILKNSAYVPEFQSTYLHNLLAYENIPEEELILRAIRASDTENCGMRLICELSSIKDRVLTREEWEIMKFVRNGDELFNRVYPGQGVRSDSAVLSEYQGAARLGSAGQPCQQIYRSCHESASQMMEDLVGFRKKVELYYR